jgi:hypothetical protein
MTDVRDKKPASGFNRRAFISGAAGAATLPLVVTKAAGAAENTAAALDSSLPVDVALQVNGTAKSLNIDARTTLLDALREHIGLSQVPKRAAITASVGLAPSWSGVAVYFMPDPGADRPRSADHDHRGIIPRRQTASDAAGLHRSGRLPVRILHAGTDRFGDRLRQGRPRHQRRRHPRIHERQHLPLRRLPEHRRRRQTGRAGDGRRTERLSACDPSPIKG